MIKGILVSLVLGILYGSYFLAPEQMMGMNRFADYALMILMFSVGISVGLNKEVFNKLKTHHFKILIIPIGIIIGSLLGGVVCSLITGFTLQESLAITSGLGWYSLSGVMLTELGGVEVGVMAFLSNLLRELFTFILIPLVAKRFNDYTAIAPAGATSEDTTLPMLMKHTSEEVVVMAVINGVICSAAVPVLLRIIYSVF